MVLMLDQLSSDKALYVSRTEETLVTTTQRLTPPLQPRNTPTHVGLHDTVAISCLQL